MASAVEQDYEITDSPSIGTALAIRPTPAASIEEVRQAMALRDDEQILAECNGAIAGEWLYSFKLKSGQVVEGLSVKGATEVARIRAEAGFALRFPVVSADEVLQNGRRGLRVTVTARDQRSGAEGIAMVFEPYEDDAGKPNHFADRKALSKARRNAILQLLPEQQIKSLLKAAKESAAGRVARKPDARDTRRPIPPKPASENLKPQDPYENGEKHRSIDDMKTEIAILCTHASVADLRAQVEERLKNGTYDDRNKALTSITGMRSRIASAGQDPDQFISQQLSGK